VGAPLCAWLRRHRRGSTFYLEAGEASQRSGSFGPGLAPLQPEPSTLWLAFHHLVALPSASSARGASSPRRCVFDFAAAESEIVLRAQGLQLSFADSPPSIEMDVRGWGESSDDELQPVSGLRARAERVAAAAATTVEASAPPAALARPARVRLSTSTREPLVRCRYAGMRCVGCGLRLGLEASVCRGGCGLIHDSSACLALARRSLAEPPPSAAAPRGALAAGCEQSGAALAEYRRLETEFALRPGGEVPLLLPSDDREAFCRFLRWCAESEERAGSLASVHWAAGELTLRTRGEDLTRHADVRRAFEALGVDTSRHTSAG